MRIISYQLRGSYLDNIKRLILAVISGCLLFLSFPKYGVGYVAWIALAPLLYAINNGSVKSSLCKGFLAGFVFNIGIIYWIAIVIVNYGYLPLTIGITAMMFLAAYLSIYVALFTGGVSYLRQRGVSQVFAAPILWTCLEYIKSHLLTGFPWENLAYSQYLNLRIIQIADITGIYGISFLIVFINALLSDLLTAFNDGFIISDRKRVVMEILGACLLLMAILYYGNLRIDDIQKKIEPSPSINISLIQGNIDQSVKWNPQNQQETLSIYKYLSGQSLNSNSGLIIWPETAVPFFFQDVDGRSRQVYQVAKEAGQWILFGSPGYTKEQGRTSFFNSAFLLSPDGIVAGRYDKVHLVPYGEYVPFRNLIPFVGKLVEGIGDFHQGKGYYPLTMNNNKIGVVICYEAIFPESTRILKKMGAQLIVNITNDAWFGFSSAPYQHLSMTVFRAVENRLYLVRAANTGISAIVDPTGKILEQTGLFVKSALKGKVRFIDSGTCYVAYGDMFAYLCFVALLLVLISSWERRKKCWKI